MRRDSRPIATDDLVTSLSAPPAPSSPAPIYQAGADWRRRLSQSRSANFFRRCRRRGDVSANNHHPPPRAAASGDEFRRAEFAPHRGAANSPTHFRKKAARCAFRTINVERASALAQPANTDRQNGFPAAPGENCRGASRLRARLIRAAGPWGRGRFLCFAASSPRAATLRRRNLE